MKKTIIILLINTNNNYKMIKSNIKRMNSTDLKKNYQIIWMKISPKKIDKK